MCGVVGPGTDADISRDRNRIRVKGGPGTRCRPAGRPGISAIQSIINGHPGGTCQDDGGTRSEKAGWGRSGDRSDPLTIKERGALLQVVLEALDLRRLAGGDIVILRRGKGAPPGALGLIPARQVPGNPFGTKLGIQSINPGLQVGARKGTGADFLPTVDVFLIEVRITEKAGPPWVIEKVRAKVTAGGAPYQGVGVAPIRGGQGAVEVPDRPREDLATAVLGPITAEAEGIDIESPNVEKVMVNGCWHIEQGSITENWISEGGGIEPGIYGIEIRSEVGSLRSPLRGQQIPLFRIIVGPCLTTSTESRITRILAVDFKDVSPGIADNIIIIGFQSGNIHPVCAPADFFHDIVDAKVIAGGTARKIEATTVYVHEYFGHAVPHGVAADGIADIITKRIVQEGGVKRKRRMKHPVRVLGHPQERHPGGVFIIGGAGFHIEAEFGISQSTGAAFVDHGAAGDHRRIGEAGAIVRSGRFPDPHVGSQIAVIGWSYAEGIDHHDRHRRAEGGRVIFQSQEGLAIGSAGQEARLEDPGPQKGSGSDGERAGV